MAKKIEKINVIGGVSFPGRIAIISDKFQSVAVFGQIDGKDEILSIVKPLPVQKITKPLLKYRWIPIPRVLRLIAFVFISSHWLIKAFIVLFFTAEILQIVFPADEQALEIISLNPAFFLSMTGFWLIMMIVLVQLIIHTRTWHGAEHMAIEAYRQNQKSDLRSIKKQSPVHPKCGGRLMAPIIVLAMISPFVASALYISDFLIVLIGFEIILWIDELIGWYRIPIFKQLSRFLQRYITTKQPSRVELLTAQVALKQLIEAHQK
ncbi:MAG: DUF1385 domain-containing protein [Patescibacteria group bacterium]